MFDIHDVSVVAQFVPSGGWLLLYCHIFIATFNFKITDGGWAQTRDLVI